MKCPQCGTQNPLEATLCSQCGKSLGVGSSDYYSMGIEAFRAGRMEEAIRFLEGAVHLQPNDARAHEYLGVAYGEKGLFFDAVKAFTRAIELAPGNARLHFNLGHLYEARHELERAREQYQAALRVDPGYDKARAALAAISPRQDPATAPRRSYIRCAFHPDVPYVEYCTSCQRPICADCVRTESSQPYCPQCAARPSPVEVPMPAPKPEISAEAPVEMMPIPAGLAGPPAAEMLPEDLEKDLTAGSRKVGFWPRLGAQMVDGFILGMLYSLFSTVLSLAGAAFLLPMIHTATSGEPYPSEIPPMAPGGANIMGLMKAVVVMIVVAVVGYVLLVGLYYVLLVGRYGQTLGKMLLKMVIVRTDGRAVGYGRAMVRWLASQIYQLPGLVGILMGGPRLLSIVRDWMVGGLLRGYTGAGGGGFSPYEFPDLPGAPAIPGTATHPSPTGLDFTPLILPLILVGASLLMGILNMVLMSADPNRQAIHDKIAGTYVVRD